MAVCFKHMQHKKILDDFGVENEKRERFLLDANNMNSDGLFKKYYPNNIKNY